MKCAGLKPFSEDRINKLNTALGMESLAEAKAPVSELYKDEDSGINYPVVDMLETQLLGQNYKKENANQTIIC